MHFLVLFFLDRKLSILCNLKNKFWISKKKIYWKNECNNKKLNITREIPVTRKQIVKITIRRTVQEVQGKPHYLHTYTYSDFPHLSIESWRGTYTILRFTFMPFSSCVFGWQWSTQFRQFKRNSKKIHISVVSTLP